MSAFARSVAALWHLHLAAEEPLVTDVERVGEDIGLGTGVVHKVLALDLEASRRERPRKRVAQGETTAVANVDRPNGIGGDELDLHLRARPE